MFVSVNFPSHNTLKWTLWNVCSPEHSRVMRSWLKDFHKFHFNALWEGKFTLTNMEIWHHVYQKWSVSPLRILLSDLHCNMVIWFGTLHSVISQRNYGHCSSGVSHIITIYCIKTEHYKADNVCFIMLILRILYSK